MANNLSFSQQGSTSGYISPLQKATTPSWQSTLKSVQSNYNANPIKTTSIPTNTGSNNQSVIHGLLSTLKTQGGTHSTTDAAGNTQTIKVNPVKNTDPVQNPTGSKNTTNATTGVTTGVFPPGTPQNQGSPAKASPQQVTLPNGQIGYTDANGNFVDANGNPMPAPQPSTGNGGTSTFPDLITAGASAASGNAALGQNAQNIGNNATQQLQTLRENAIPAEGGFITAGGTSPVQLGRAGALASLEAQQEQKITGQENAALNANAQGLTAQNQETTGLLGAAGNIKPESNFPFVFNPATGTFTAPGTGGGSTSGAPTLTYNPQTDSQNLAQAVMDGKIGYSDAITALSYGANASTAPGQLSSAIIALGGNPTNLQAKAGAVAAGVTGNVQDTQAIAGAQNNIDSITSLITNGNLNPSKINLANEGIQAIQQNLSNSDYQTLLNGLQSIDAALSKVTGSPVDIATLSSTQGTSLLATINNQVAYAKGIAAGKVQNGSTGGSSGSTSGANPWH